jgi:hypothetical protein
LGRLRDIFARSGGARRLLPALGNIPQLQTAKGDGPKNDSLCQPGQSLHGKLKVPVLPQKSVLTRRNKN